MSRPARAATGFGLALGALAAVVVGLDLGPCAEVSLWCAPLCALVVPLLLGRYAGEELLAECRTRRGVRRRVVPAGLGAPRSARRHRVGGGRLVAASLAGRGPPLVARCA